MTFITRNAQKIGSGIIGLFQTHTFSDAKGLSNAKIVFLFVHYSFHTYCSTGSKSKYQSKQRKFMVGLHQILYENLLYLAGIKNKAGRARDWVRHTIYTKIKFITDLQENRNDFWEKGTWECNLLKGLHGQSIHFVEGTIWLLELVGVLVGLYNPPRMEKNIWQKQYRLHQIPDHRDSTCQISERKGGVYWISKIIKFAAT